MLSLRAVLLQAVWCHLPSHLLPAAPGQAPLVFSNPSGAKRCFKGGWLLPTQMHSPSSSQCSARRFSSSVIITRVMTWSGTRRPLSRYCFAKTPTSVQVKNKNKLKLHDILHETILLPLKFCLPSEIAHPFGSTLGNTELLWSWGMLGEG